VFHFASKIVKIKTYRTIILPVVLYGYETWSLMFREEHRLRMYENRVLRRMFGPKREKVTEEGRRLHNVKFHDLFASPNVILMIKLRRMRWVGLAVCMAERTGAYRVLVVGPEGKRPHRRTRHRWEYIIKMGLQELG
jgi:hypothetical protein